MSDAAESDPQFRRAESNQDVELLLLAGAQAIQRLIAERDTFRSRADAQQRELTRLRRHLNLIHESYRRLTTEYVTQFQLIDNAVGDFVREGPEIKVASGDAQQT
jgi:hypothetical protein